MSLPDRMADIIERAMRKLLDAQLEQVSSWMTEHSFATGHGDTVADLLKELNWQMAERVAQAFSDGAAQHEKVWGAALMNEIANLKAQQAERVKEARIEEAKYWGECQLDDYTQPEWDECVAERIAELEAER